MVFFCLWKTKKHHFKVLFTYKELKTPRRTKIPLKRESLLLERSLFCSSRLHLFDQIYSKNCQILLSLKIAVFLCEYNWKSCISASLLQSSVSHDPSEIIIICWFAAQEIFLIILMLKTVVLHNILWKLWCILFFRIHRLIESSKEQHLCEIDIFCNVINVFTVTLPLFFTYHNLWLCITIFNIDNNQECFLSSKSAYYYDFWRIMWHWRLQ